MFHLKFAAHIFILHIVTQENHIISIVQSGLKDFKEENPVNYQ